MKLHRTALFIGCAWLGAFATLSHAQDAADVVMVEVDVYSGRPNPVVELSAEELADLMRMARPLCERLQAASDDNQEARLGYRGLSIGRGKRGSSAQQMVRITGKRARLRRSAAPVLCHESMARAAGSADLTFADDNRALEKALLQLARQKGAISESLHGVILQAMESGG